MNGSPSSNLTTNQKNLIRRYLIWCYKTTKEELDRIDRYATQNMVDTVLLKKLRNGLRFKKASADDSYRALIIQFQEYMQKKLENADQKKFVDGFQKDLKPEYQYLLDRCRVIEETIRYFLGKKELAHICSLYEQEMIQRILQAKEHT